MELRVELAQNLVLSQRMIQSTEILQMSAQELEIYLKEATVENPVMELEEKYDSFTQNRERDIERKLEWLAGSDEQNRVYYSEEYSSDDDDHQDMWNVTDQLGEGLNEYLLSQLMALPISAQENKIVHYLIDLLDDKGYLTETMEQLADTLNVSEEKIQNAVKILQSFEPAGVGARNLSECLLLQMDRQKIEHPIAREIVADYLELLGKNQLPQIAKKLKITVDDILEALELIRSLNPKPGNSFSSRENLKYIIPDVTVVKLKDYFEILLNEYMYPKLHINTYYRQILQKDDNKDTKEYLTNKVKQAEWIMQCVSQRNTTLMNVSKCIVDVQEKFFSYGPGYLKPLKLADVADMIGIHESTVSRAVKDKYLQCSWGVYPMNYFFLGAIGGKNTVSSTTADQAKTAIKDVVEHENKDKPLSDRLIAEKLEKMGIKISRRTVTKYREALGIKDATGRKVY